MNILGIILARRNSEGLQGKHLLPVCGRPVIDYTFDHAASSRCLTRTVVSTDCPNIRQLAQARNLQVIDRPARLATSTASVQDAMLHALDVVEERGGYWTDVLVVLYGNVPVRGDGVIDRAVELLLDTKCDSVRSFCSVGKWHPAWMCRLEGDRAESVVPGSVHRRQDLAPLYLHDGAVVAVSRASMLRGRDNPRDPHAFFGVDRRGIVCEPGETVEIDHRRDLFLADAILRERDAIGIPHARVA